MGIANLEIHDDTFTSDMQKIFAVDSGNCRGLTMDEWQDRHLVTRFSEASLSRSGRYSEVGPTILFAISKSPILT